MRMDGEDYYKVVVVGSVIVGIGDLLFIIEEYLFRMSFWICLEYFDLFCF